MYTARSPRGRARDAAAAVVQEQGRRPLAAPSIFGCTARRPPTWLGRIATSDPGIWDRVLGRRWQCPINWACATPERERPDPPVLFILFEFFFPMDSLRTEGILRLYSHRELPIPAALARRNGSSVRWRVRLAACIVSTMQVIMITITRN